MTTEITNAQIRALSRDAAEAGDLEMVRACTLALGDIATAGVYDLTTGDTITEGLSPSSTSSEAIECAHRIADRLGRDVLLADDDGEWIVHPAIGREREPADAHRTIDDARAECARSILANYREEAERNARRLNSIKLRWAEPLYRQDLFATGRSTCTLPDGGVVTVLWSESVTGYRYTLTGALSGQTPGWSSRTLNALRRDAVRAIRVAYLAKTVD